jgi:3-oxoacyl-[acyl-carrier-protein] synthase II
LLDQIALEPRDVQLVAASACGSPEGDWVEARAIREVFGGGAEAPLVMAPKGILGETWGASGPLAAAAVIESMRTGRIPGRPRGFVPDPDLPPINMPPEPLARRVRNAVVLARTETGHLSALLLSEPEGNDAA